MKKIFLMCAFAGFTAFAASAQTEPTASSSAKKSECTKVCTPEEKAACTAKMANKAACCASGKASSTAMAAKTEKPAATTKKVVATTGNK